MVSYLPEVTEPTILLEFTPMVTEMLVFWKSKAHLDVYLAPDPGAKSPDIEIPGHMVI